MIGQRLAEARKRAGLAQVELAVALGDRYNQQMISNVERGRRSLRFAGAAKAAKELGVSLDYLAGLTADPTPAADRSGAASVIAEARTGYEAEDSPGRRPVEVLEIASAAGVGAEVFDETRVGLLWFRNDWLTSHSIDSAHCNIISVSGASMEPTLPDGCSILVDRNRREPIEGRIYVLRTEEGLVVKRLGLDELGNWQVVSDNADWPPTPLRYGAEIIGEVRWSAVTY